MIGAIVQVRVGSTRLPRKALAEISGKTMTWHVINRVKHSKLIRKVVVATTMLPEDDAIADVCKEAGVECFRGSKDDVLDRFYNAARQFNISMIVRITGDCPLIDPEIIDKVIEFFKQGDYDYASNVIPPSFPDGLDVEVFSFKALEKAWKSATLTSDREHVAPYIWRNNTIFKVGNFSYNKDLSRMRWTVDNKEDLSFVKKIYKKLYKQGKLFLMGDVITLLEKAPQLASINNQISRNEGYVKSLKEDKRVK